MADENRDVIRLEAATDADVTGPTPISVKLKQFVHSLATGKLWYKDSSGQLILFRPAADYASQTGAGGSTLVGDAGITGVTPSGGTINGPGTVHNMMVGLKDYAAAIAGGADIKTLFIQWDETFPGGYSVYNIVWAEPVDSPQPALYYSKIDGNTTDPRDETGDWQTFSFPYPLSKMLSFIMSNWTPAT